MLHLPSNVLHSLAELVPSSVYKDITCFVFSDDHPRDEAKVDVTVCTSKGEITEFYQREAISSLFINCIIAKIKTLRNCHGELFYLADAGDTIFVISTRKKLKIHKRIRDVESYVIDDTACRGQAGLKVICKDDAVPFVFDDELNDLADEANILCQYVQTDTFPIITDLMVKLVHAKFDVINTEKALEKLLSVRQSTAFNTYRGSAQCSGPLTADGLAGSVIKLRNEKPWVKVCNNKIVIVLEAISSCEEQLADVHILLHHTSQKATNYKTELFKSIDEPPYWNKVSNLKQDSKTAIVAIADLNELKHSCTSKVKFHGVLSYKIKGEEIFTPLDEVEISSLDTMGGNFDVLSSIGTAANADKILAVLATTKKVELLIRHVKNDMDPTLNILELSKQYLKMEGICDSIVAHTHSPYHALNGLMVVSSTNGQFDGHHCLVTTYSRSESQVLAFIHYIYDSVPYHLIITTPECKITAKTESLANFNEEVEEYVF